MKDAISSTKLSELICTRMCHDIIGNIGAVANGVELLEEGDLDFLPDIKNILSTSSEVLSARLKFFRLAFGSSNSGLSDFVSVKIIAENYLKTLGNRNNIINLDWSEQYSSEELNKVIILLLVVCGDCIAREGKITVSGNNQELFIKVNARTFAAQSRIDDIAKIIEFPNYNIIAQYSPLLYAIELLNNKSLKLGFVKSDEEIKFVISN